MQNKTNATKMKFEVTPLSVYDIAEYIDTYRGEVEDNLQHCPEDLAAYEKDPAPFMIDLLGDFGEVPAEIQLALDTIKESKDKQSAWTAYDNYMKVAVRNNLKNWTTNFDFSVFCE